MKNKTIGFFIVVLMCFGVLSLGPPAVAQQDGSDEFMLEEITVTAEKREVNVQDTAMSVTAIAGANIRDNAENTLEDVLRNIASVEVAYANRGGQINIRGIGSYVDTSMADPAVAVIEDNIYNGNSLATFGSMYDIDRVEVLRGPQGTLYGRNATGGTINVISAKPKHETEIVGNFQIGDYNLKHFDGAVNWSLSESWAARIAVLRETRDGYLSSGDMDSNVFGSRMKLLYEPNEKFSLLATYEYFWERDHGSNTVPIPGSAGNLPQLGPPSTGGYTKPDLNRDNVADDFLDADLNETADLNGDGWPDGDGIGDLMQTGWVVPAGSDAWTNDEWHPAGSSFVSKDAYSLEFNYDFGWGVLTAIPSFAKEYNHNVDNHLAGISRSAGVSAYDLGVGQKNAREQTSGELRLTSPSESDIFWIAGYYYMKTDNATPGFQQDDPTTYYDGDYHIATARNPTVSQAVFGQATYPLTDRFRVTGGIRAANDKLKNDFRIGFSTAADGVLYDSGWVHYEQDVDSTTYKAGIEFDLADSSMLYAQVATGFKQGGLNTTAPPIEFKPEELTAYELGVKNRFMENRMQLNLEAFYYQYDNMQAQMPSTAPIGDTGAILEGAMMILNAEEGTLKGLDLEWDYLLTQDDILRLSASYLSSEVGAFVLPPNPFQAVPAPFDMTGRQMSSSPEWAFTVSYEHTWHLDNGDSVTGMIDSKISDGYYRTLEQWQPYAWEEGYTRSNFNVTYRTADGTWSAGVWAKNLENGAQYTWSVPFWRGQIKAPRTFGLSVSYRY